MRLMATRNKKLKLELGPRAEKKARAILKPSMSITRVITNEWLILSFPQPDFQNIPVYSKFSIVRQSLRMGEV